MNRKQFKQWLKRMYATVETEIGCDKVQALLPILVDVEISGGNLLVRFSSALAHLAQCPDCADEYRGLREVARLEAQGRLPQVEESLSKFEATSVLEQGEPV